MKYSAVLIYLLLQAAPDLREVFMDRRCAEYRGECGLFGRELRKWRRIRAFSQLDLALEANVSPRHLSFVETGRAAPGRELVLRLTEVLDVPIRARNAMLAAAGYAPAFRETTLAAPAMEGVRTALQYILAKQEPFPAIVVRPDWTVIMANGASVRWRRLFFSDAQKERAGAAGGNAMKTFFDPLLFRPFIVNWEACARAIVLRLRYEAAEDPDGASACLLRDLMTYPGVPDLMGLEASPLPPNEPLMTVHMTKGDIRISYFSMLTTFGTPHDATLEELRIKLFFPADVESSALFRRLAEAEEAGGQPDQTVMKAPLDAVSAN